MCFNNDLIIDLEHIRSETTEESIVEIKCRKGRKV
jgi:hypothetical protein